MTLTAMIAHTEALYSWDKGVGNHFPTRAAIRKGLLVDLMATSSMSRPVTRFPPRSKNQPLSGTRDPDASSSSMTQHTRFKPCPQFPDPDEDLKPRCRVTPRLFAQVRS